MDKEATTEKGCYTINEAAPRMGLTPYKLRQLVDAGEVRSVSAGGTILIPLCSIKEWLGEIPTIHAGPDPETFAIDSRIKSLEMLIEASERELRDLRQQRIQMMTTAPPARRRAG